MTVLLQMATKKYGSMRKLSLGINVNPSVLAQVNTGIRKAWPKLRNAIAEALEMRQEDLFNENGWPKNAE